MIYFEKNCKECSNTICKTCNTNYHLSRGKCLNYPTPKNENIKCTNDECISILEDKESSITYIKYDR